MWVAIVSMCTAQRGDGPAESGRPDPRGVDRVEHLRSSAAISGSGLGSPDRRVSARFAIAAARSKVPPIPMPIVTGGLALGPAFSIVSTTKSTMAGVPAAA